LRLQNKRYIFPDTAKISTKTPACVIRHLHQQSQHELLLKFWSQKAGYANFSLLQTQDIAKTLGQLHLRSEDQLQSYFFKWNCSNGIMAAA
jgi:hypothetical protein